LLKHVGELAKDEGLFLFIDLYPTLTLNDFIRLLSNAILHQLEPFSEKIIRKVTGFFSLLKPRFSFDPATGAPNLELSVTNSSEVEKSVSLLFEYIRQSGKKVTVAFDEFQQITNYPEQNVEAILRSEIQKDSTNSYIFSGSLAHLIVPMFNEYSRPFYQSTGLLYLPKIEKKEYSGFILRQFNKNSKKIEFPVADYIYEKNNGITYNVQYVCNKLFSSGENEITNEQVDYMMEEILKDNEMVYYNYRELVTALQYKILKAVAKEKIVDKPLSGNFISSYNLGSASSVKTAVETLANKGILTNSNGLRVTDWFFSLWLANQL
jgi:hypothetical protein